MPVKELRMQLLGDLERFCKGGREKMDKSTKYLIIGAGISGLTFANYIKEDYLIIEKEDEVGGYCRTIKRGDYVWDYAGHFFHFSTDEFKKRFIDSVKKDEIIYKDKNTKIIYNNNLVDYPFQTNIHQLDKDEFIDCLYDLFHKEEKGEYNNFLDMLYGKFGQAIVEKFLRPYNEKLYAVDLRTLDTDAMGRFFPYADIPAIINNMKANKDSTSYNSTFLYPRFGAGSFIDLLCSTLKKENILMNQSVVKINNKNVILENGTKIEYEYLINTSPLNTFLSYFEEKELNDLQKELSYNKVLVFNLGFNKKSKYTKEHWFYVPDKNINFYRVGFYDNILDADKLSMYIEIGYRKEDDILIEEQLDLTLKNLQKLGITDSDTILEEYSTIVMDPAYVHINAKTDKHISEVKEKLKKEKIYSIGRYGAWTYCSMEDCMIAAKELADSIRNL
ncbi:FAD-dependent oxidoreductase [Lachnospiraceae bacterium 42-17]